jgi:tRNA pseudouridine13 synthase
LFLTADIPGCGGATRVAPEDFVVDEVPAYLPSGEGEHLFLKVWKRGLGTPEAAALLARHFGCPERELSWAGLKDSFAVTTQWLSLPARLARNLETFSHEQVRVLEHKKHGNKLKGGHLGGNRFALRIAGVKDVAAAQASFARLAKEGIPNAFGTQRFGAHGDNASKGKEVLLGKARVGRFQRKLFLSAYQSSLFNRLLGLRLAEGTFARALTGDVLKKHETGGEFVCADAAVDQPRVDAFEVSATGPMYGPKMRAAEGGPGEAEAAVLRDEGLTLASFEAGRGETEGARRFYRVPLASPEFEVTGEDVWLRFALPSGSYATVVLGELLKR